MESKRINRIDVTATIPDTRASKMARGFHALDLAGTLESVTIVDSYTTNAQLKDNEIKKVLRALTNPLMEKSTFSGKIISKPFTLAVEIGYLPGVTDNVGTTASETIVDAIGRQIKDIYVSTSRVYVLYGKVSEGDANKIAGTLYNPLIERAKIISWKEYVKEGGFPRVMPEVHLHERASADIVSLDISEMELKTLGERGIANADGTRRGPLALSLVDLEAVRIYFKTQKRNPTDIELETIAQTWSEHCKHRIFASPMEGAPEGLYRDYIKRATKEIRQKKGKKDFCVSVFSDNSGVIAFDKNWLVTHKVETHNSPSALDPFGGAITGVVGVNRDAIGTGIGSKPVANIYGFCVGNPDDSRTLFRDGSMKEKMLSPRRILDGVVKGINSGGNASGIPTVHGFLMTEDRFRGKPLVFAGTIGLLPRKVAGKNGWEKRARPGDLIVTVGNRVGLDGIHGATFSSVKLDEGSPATAVQIGDPITQKKFSDAIVKEARDLGLYNSITDNGAGGLSSAVGEMAEQAGGCSVNLEKVPIKYPGLAPWQIWISESQERMTLAVPPSKWKKLSALLTSRGVEATVIGEFTKSGNVVASWNNKKIMDLSLEFLHDGWPRRELSLKKPEFTLSEMTPKLFGDIEKDLLALLARPSLASNLFIAEQYDHEVQGGSVMKPIQGAGRVTAPTSVFKPVLDAKAGVLTTSALYPTYSYIDTYDMAAASIDTAVRQALAGGAPWGSIAILDNFCWSKSNTPEGMYNLRESARACYEIASAYETPFISGKDSMHNDFNGFDEKGNEVHISVPPTLLISAIAVLPDALSSTSLDFKRGGDLLYVIGETHDEFGGSEFSAMKSKDINAGVPKVNALAWTSRYKKFAKARALASSAGAVARGGLGATLSKMAIAGGLGFEADFSKLSGTFTSTHSALFSESQGRFVVTVPPRNRKAFESAMGAEAKCIGKVRSDKQVNISNKKQSVIKTSVESLQKAYEKTFKNF